MTQVLEKAGLGAHWMPQEALLKASISPELARLIVQVGSLTERLRAASSASFSVRVLRQETRSLSEFSDHLLAGRSGSGLLREVYLVSDGSPAVFAQTLVPGETLRVHPWLAGLGDEPLGQQLFARPDLERRPFDYACLTPVDQLARHALAGLGRDSGFPDELWARRSLFLLSGYPVSVNEVFFPAAVPAAAR